MSPSITVHHLDRSRSQRVLWLLEELGAPYEIQQWKRGRDFRAPPELRAVHPLGLAPIVVVDGDVLVESGAILEGLLDRLEGGDALRPADELDAFRMWLHYAEGSLMPPLLVKLLTNKLRTTPPFPVRLLTGLVAGQLDAAYTDGQIDRQLSFVEDHLEDREWFLSSFSAADIQLGYPLYAAMQRGGERPAIRAWLERCMARPAWQRSIEKGGPLDV